MRRIPVFLICSLLASQLDAGPQRSSETATIKASTELVLVPVVVHKSGAHLGGLKKESFTLLQDEQPQEIAIFEEVHPPAPTAISPREQESRFSNIRANQDAERLTIIAVDLVNTAPLDQLYLKKEIIKFLEAAAESGERYALIAITTNGLHVLQDFTTDPKLVVSAMSKEGAKATGSELPGSTGVAVFDQTPCADSGGGCGTRGNNLKGLKELQLWLNLYKTEESFEIFRDRDARLDTLSSLQQVGQWLSGVPGRKTLVWAGSGIQIYGGMTRVAAGNGPRRNYSTFNFRSVDEAMDENAYTFKVLSAANIAVYPLDARHGANTSFASYDSSRTDAPIGQGAFGGQKGRVQNEDQEIIAMFEQIASSTGGKPCFNRTDLANCLKEFAVDSRDYYMLGFYVDKKKTNPGWHTLAIKLDQKADVRHRKGFALAAPSEGKAEVSDLQLALSSPLPYTGVQMSGQFTKVEGGGDKRRVHFELEIPGETIVLADPDNALKLEIVAIVRGVDGKQVATFSQRIDRKLQAEQASLIRGEGIHYTNRLEVPAGSYGVWFAVRDANTGRTGSVVTKLSVQ